MKKSMKIMTSLATGLMLSPFATTLATIPTLQVYAQTQMQSYLSLGASLNAEQAAVTKNLLGAGQFNDQQTLYVNGDIINQYLRDGSNSSTTVYSSAYIQQQPEGYGVQVQIVTPQNITLVSPTTYQNAAITSGAKNVLIKIATVNAVTGEGALAGVYALLAKSGVKIDEQAVKVAEKEIKVVEVVKKEVNLSDTQVNQIISEIKKEVTNQVANQGGTINNQAAETIVNNVVNNITNNVDNSVTINITEETKQDLATLAEEYAQTDAAKSTETIEQLEKSVDNALNAPWSEVLNNIDDQEVKTTEELLQAERQNYDDTTIYHPIIPAMFKAYYQGLETQQLDAQSLYAHTFVLEKVLPDLKPEEKQALNQLRLNLYYYVKQQDAQLANVAGEQFKTLKTRWLNQLTYALNLAADAATQSLVEQFAVATGLAPEAYLYHLVQDGNSVTAMVKTNELTHEAAVATLMYDTASQTIMPDPLVMGANATVFDFNAVYGVPVQSMYQPAYPLTVDFTLPGYQKPVESSEETATAPSAAAEAPTEAAVEGETEATPETTEESASAE